MDGGGDLPMTLKGMRELVVIEDIILWTWEDI
jgi:hypothetical protein